MAAQIEQISLYQQLSPTVLNNISKDMVDSVLPEIFSKIINGANNVIIPSVQPLVTQNTGSDYNVIVNPFFALTSTGRILICNSATTIAFTAPAAYRRDIVVSDYAYTNTGATGEEFLNPLTKTISTTTTYTKFQIDNTLTVVQGTNGSATAPATPTGKFKICEVYIDSTGGIANADISNFTDTWTATAATDPIIINSLIDRDINKVLITNTTLNSNQKYTLVTDVSIDLTLPALAKPGDPIEIFTVNPSRLLQGDAENVIGYKNKWFTTKGTSGYVQLPQRSSIELIYKGTGGSIVLPGTKVSALTALDGGGLGCSFSPDGVYLACSHGTSPYATVYKRSGDTFTKVSALTALNGDGFTCAWSPDGVYVAYAHSGSPYATVYKRSGDVFTKVSALTALDGIGYGCSFSPDGIYLAYAHAGSPYATVYKRSGDTFTKVSALTALDGGGLGCSFSPDNTYVAYAHSGSPYATVYKRSGDTFTKVSALTALDALGNGCSFSPDTTYLAYAHNNSPYVTVYKNLVAASKMWEVKNLNTLYETTKDFMFK